MNVKSLIKSMILIGASDDEIKSAVEEATGPNPIRKFTKEELNIYGQAALTATFMMPAFRDAVALLRPFYDATCESSYVDPDARSGFGPAFFSSSQTKEQRATYILHESMHVLYNHFSRSEDFKMDQMKANLAGDFEINSTLSQVPKADTSLDVLPDMEPFFFEKFKSFEQYAVLLQGMGQGDSEGGQNTSSKSGGSPDGDGEPDQDSEDGGSSSSGQGESDSSDSSSDEGGGNSDGSEDADSSEGGSGSSGDGDDSEEGSDSGGSPSSSSSGSESSKDSDGSKDGSSGSSGGKKDSENDSQGSGSGSGDGSSEQDIDSQIEKARNDFENSTKGENQRSCSPLTAKRSESADEIGVEKASVTEQSVVKSNTIAMVREEAQKSLAAGDSGMHSILKMTEMALAQPKVKWQTLLKKVLGRASDQVVKGRSDYSYRKPNRRNSSSEFIQKGMIGYEPSGMVAFDTSGSMGRKDYQNQFSEIEEIAKRYFRGRGRFKVFPVTTTIGAVQPVKSVKDIEITGGGGTDMSVAFKYINSLSRAEKPDVFILSTDGGTDWYSIEKEIKKMQISYPPIILITRKGGIGIVPEHLLDGSICKILDIS